MSVTALIKATESLKKREGDLLPILKAVFFEELKRRYPRKKIKDILLDHKGGSWGSDFFQGSINAKVLRSPDIRFGFIDFENAEERFFSKKEIENFNLNNNDILVIKSNGSLDLVGKSQLYKANNNFPHVVASNFLMVLRPNEEIIYPEYLDLFLKSPESLVWRFDTQKTTTGLRNLNTAGFLNIEVPVPKTIKEQRGLFKTFGDYLTGKINDEETEIKRFYFLAKKKETLASELTTQDNLLSKLRQSFLREAMQGKLVKQDPKDGHAKDLLEKIKAEKARSGRKGKELPPIKPEEIPFEIPENWVWCRLGLIIEFISGNNFKSTDFKKGAGARCIKITNAGVGEIVETDDVLPISFLEKYKSFLVFEDDLVLALTRPYISDGLKISKCPKLYHNSLLNQRVAAIRACKKIDADFVYQFLRSDYVLNIYKSKFEGKGQQPNLRKEDVTQLLIPVPPLHEQNRIVKKLDELMNLCDGLQESIQASREQNELLLQQVLKEALPNH